jgi:hypothetical protein
LQRLTWKIWNSVLLGTQWRLRIYLDLWVLLSWQFPGPNPWFRLGNTLPSNQRNSFIWGW